MKFIKIFGMVVCTLLFCSWSPPVDAHLLPIYPGDTIILMELERGIPVYPEVENLRVEFHYPSRGEVEVIEVGGFKKRWIHVRDQEGKQGWIVKKYVDKVIPGPRGLNKN